MTSKQFARAAALVSLGSLLSLIVVTQVSFANSISEPTASATEQDSSDSSDSSDTRQGIPGRRLSGGTRKDTVFANDLDSLTALTTPDPVSITTADYPTLMFYVPEMASKNNVEFVLRDSNDDLVYETTFLLNSDAGLVSVDTAEAPDMPALSLNKDYQWYFSIVPDSSDRANDAVVYGSIRRVDQAEWLTQRSAEADSIPDLSEQLATASPLMQARILYQQANLWHDAALMLSEMRQADPENDAIAAEWTQLLESVGLANVLQTPLPTVQASLH